VGEENISVPVTLANYGTILSLNRQNRSKAVNLYGTVVKALDASLIFSTYGGGVYWPGRDRAKPVFIYLRGRLPSSASVSNDRFRESHFRPLTARLKRIAAGPRAVEPVRSGRSDRTIKTEIAEVGFSAKSDRAASPPDSPDFQMLERFRGKKLMTIPSQTSGGQIACLDSFISLPDHCSPKPKAI
jgi:hypothetical protein